MCALLARFQAFGLARLLIATVLFFNLQAALAFWLHPADFAPAYELSGAVGAAVMQGYAVLFVMWNVPYAIAVWQPSRQVISLWGAFAMQSIGLMGEFLILKGIPIKHELLWAAITRFILFDALGLLLLAAALGLVYYNRPKS